MLLKVGPTQTLGVCSQPRLRFGDEPTADPASVGMRFLWLDGEPAFELTFWTGTTPYLFKRLWGANQKVSLDDISQRLAAGLTELDNEIIGRYGDLLPRGGYLPLLMDVHPRLIRPLDPDDYFAGEQIETWGLSPFWGLPEYPATPYYRTFEAPIAAERYGRSGPAHHHLFEFVVPMVPPSWNAQNRVAQYAELLAGPSSPTAVAVSTLDVCEPAVDTGGDMYAHWILTHFLLDGHHKFQAATETGHNVRLLSLLSVDAGLASREQISLVTGFRGQPRGRRVRRTTTSSNAEPQDNRGDDHRDNLSGCGGLQSDP